MAHAFQILGFSGAIELTVFMLCNWDLEPFAVVFKLQQVLDEKIFCLLGSICGHNVRAASAVGGRK